MLLRMLVLAAVTGTIGFAAGRVTQEEPAPREASRHAGEQAASAHAGNRHTPPAPVAQPVDDAVDHDEAATDEAGDDTDDGEDVGEDVGELLAAANEHVEELRHERNAIVGRVADRQTGEPLAGVTVIATSGALPGTQTAITDEQGSYEISGLAIGSYTLTFYYDDATDTRDGVPVSSVAVTRDVELFDTSAVSIDDTYVDETVDLPEED